MQLLRLLSKIALVALVPLTANAQSMPVVDPADFVAKYGKPDQIRSTEYDKPRPPFVTKMLEYKKENVRIVLLANVPMGSPPPTTPGSLWATKTPGTTVSSSSQRLNSVSQAEKNSGGHGVTVVTSARGHGVRSCLLPQIGRAHV